MPALDSRIVALLAAGAPQPTPAIAQALRVDGHAVQLALRRLHARGWIVPAGTTTIRRTIPGWGAATTHGVTLWAAAEPGHRHSPQASE